MEILISYFYKIRFFPRHYIPMSTAIWDPKWYHEGQGNDYIYLDRRGVINGLRCEFFAPKYTTGNPCRGRDGCKYTPDTCDFINSYRSQLSRLNLDMVLNYFEEGYRLVKEYCKVDKEPIIVLIVYEKPDNPCSERQSIVDYFAMHNIQVREFDETLL